MISFIIVEVRNVVAKNSGLALKNKVLKIDRIHCAKSISNLVSRPMLRGIGALLWVLDIICIETEWI